jgi:hypothetical protein
LDHRPTRFQRGNPDTRPANCAEKIKKEKNMPATFRKVVIVLATMVVIAGTTVRSAEARWGGWGWGWGGFGVGLGTGLLIAAATRPYYGGYYGYGYPYYGGYPYSYGYAPSAYGYPYGYGYRRAYYGAGYYPRYRYAGYYPYRRYYRYAY